MPSITMIEELRHQRHAEFEAMKELNDKALAEERDFTPEEQQEYERREAEYDALSVKIERTEKLEGITPTITRGAATGETADAAVDSDERFAETLKEYREGLVQTRPQDAGEYRQAFFRWMQDPSQITDVERRVMSKASGAAGLYAVPTQFFNELVSALRTTGVMRQISRVITTDSGASLQVPKVTAHGTASWIAESGAVSFSDETLAQATLGAYNAKTAIKVSIELLQDTAFDLESYIRDEFAARIGVLENTAYVVGDGSGKPTGVATQASAGVSAAGASAITADELIDLYHSLAPPYRRNASFVANDSTIKLWRKLKDTTNQYLWQSGLQAGQPDTLLGKPVYADPDMATAATTNVSVLFGDFSYYWIRDVNGIQFQRLNELYAENGQVGWIAYHRTDGNLLNTSAVKKLTQA